MSHTRRLAFVAGFLYLLTVVTSIPALALKDPVLADPPPPRPEPPRCTGQPGSSSCSPWRASEPPWHCSPVVRRVDEATALGFVGSRTLEAAIIVMGSSRC